MDAGTRDGVADGVGDGAADGDHVLVGPGDTEGAGEVVGEGVAKVHCSPHSLLPPPTSEQLY